MRYYGCGSCCLVPAAARVARERSIELDDRRAAVDRQSVLRGQGAGIPVDRGGVVANGPGDGKTTGECARTNLIQSERLRIGGCRQAKQCESKGVP